MTFAAERRQVLAFARQMSAAALSRGTSGNVSIRVDGGFLVTPSGMAYDKMRTADLVHVRSDGTVPARQRTPSSEWRIHRDLYTRRGDVHAVVHAHPVFCTTLACLRREIPAVHYMIAVTGGAIVPCAAYATFGTQALSDNTLAALGNGKACLLANHGMVAVGRDLPEAFSIASEVELLAEEYWRALQVGTPHILPDDEIVEVIARFASHGQRPGRRLDKSPTAADV